jgi:hypothetical protein
MVFCRKKSKDRENKEGGGVVGCERRLECVGCAAETKRVFIGLKRGFD